MFVNDRDSGRGPGLYVHLLKQTQTGMKTPSDYTLAAQRSIERHLEMVNKAHDKTRKHRTSKNVVDKINEENELFDLQTQLYTFRKRLIDLRKR